MNQSRLLLYILAIVTGPSVIRGDESAPDPTPNQSTIADARIRTQTFQFNYRFDVTGLEANQNVRVWMPVPSNSPHQRVTRLAYELPARPAVHTEPRFGNRVLYLEFVSPESGGLSFSVPYRIRRHAALALHAVAGNGDPHELSRRQRKLFLQANTNVPIDGRPLELLAGVHLSNDAGELARQLYELVDRHVTYRKTGTGWGNGDVLWVCDSGYGNCTDFHSLFISLARSQGVPSRFEIGFPIDGDAPEGAVGGYHCWASFFTERDGWVPVDISEADKEPALKEFYFGGLTPDRVAFSTGRDIELVPESESAPLNYFIYPHIEVDGTPLPSEHILLNFSYTDRRE